MCEEKKKKKKRYIGTACIPAHLYVPVVTTAVTMYYGGGSFHQGCVNDGKFSGKKTAVRDAYNTKSQSLLAPSDIIRRLELCH